jgi:hypothetical protein
MTRFNSAEPSVVDALDLPTQGAANALLDRVTQLQTTAAGVSHYISTLQDTSFKSAELQDTARNILFCNTYSHFFAPRPETSYQDNISPSDSFPGVMSLLGELARYESECTKGIQDLWEAKDIRQPFLKIVNQLEIENQTINQALSKDRLGRAQQKSEATLCRHANRINGLIQHLKVACLRFLAPEPHLDPYILSKTIRQNLDDFQDFEYEYTMQCIHEGEAAKELEDKVFRILQQAPGEHLRLMSTLLDEANERLIALENRACKLDFDADWTLLETIHEEEFPDEKSQPIEMTAENHPDEGQFVQFERLHLTTLEVQNRLEQSVDGKILKGIHRLKNAISGKKRYSACGAVWSISTAGHLIQYNHVSSQLVAMYNLRKCKLGELTEDSDWGYFSLVGQKMTFSAKGKVKRGRKKKEHKFRLPKDEALAVHDALKEFVLI